MKKTYKALIMAALLFGTLPLQAADAPANKAINIRLVDFKSCIEKSKLGKKEQENFDAMKSQMEKIVEEKQKAINEIADKLSDADYVDSLTADAETDMKRKFRAMSQEFSQMQNQYYQLLQQANMKILQKIAETISAASETVARNNHFDMILNSEGSFFNDRSLDVSDLVVKEMDKLYEEEQKKAPQQPTSPLGS